MSQQLPRTRRLTRKKEFDRVFTSGKRIAHQGISARIAAAPNPRLGIALSRKYGSNVQRNLFKRRVRAAFRQLYQQMPAADMVITCKGRSSDIGYREISDFFQYLINHDTVHNQKSDS
ncbi:MAG: ribonuclease P protein component [Fidelibacterota bacterium]|nr:MAG: ribonuclease P protein component [Candidatus Neomarinimicrobiota bacterium]